MLFARYAVSEIQDDAYGEGYQDGLDAAPCALEVEETSTEESPEE